jgi:hypothetical protein
MGRFMSIAAFVLNISNPAYQFDEVKELLSEKIQPDQISVGQKKPLDVASA